MVILVADRPNGLSICEYEELRTEKRFAVYIGDILICDFLTYDEADILAKALVERFKNDEA